MKHILLAVVILVAVPAFGQEIKHAPTADQCQADQRLWTSQFNDWATAADKTKTVVNSLLLAELDQRRSEMNDCVEVLTSGDGRLAPVAKYIDAAQWYGTVEMIRYVNFIARHNLGGQLQQEDAAGAR